MGSLPSPPRRKVNRVCIIGAGPSGLAAAKYLIAERAFSNITIYEQRGDVGGLWNHASVHEDDRDAIPVPQISPAPLYTKRKRATGSPVQEPMILSPAYDQLEANVPKGLMGFSDLDWPDDCQLFPGHGDVLRYLQRYAEGLERYIRFETQVTKVLPNTDKGWLVQTTKLCPDTDHDLTEEAFDAVIVANGHFQVPYIPSVPGIEEWNTAFPGSISHAMLYRKPEDFAGKKVIVVGSFASGQDIGAQIATVCALPLLQSHNIQTVEQVSTLDTLVDKPRITQFVTEHRRIHFADGSIEHDIDALVYCTGYFYSMPFLDSLDPPVIVSGTYVEQTYQHIFYRPQPTLAFVAINQKVIPFPIAEAQSAVIARVWSGRLDLPSNDKMAEWERKTMEEAGGSHDFHVLKFPKDADYINMLHDWTVSADSLDEQPKTIGKAPPFWTAKEYWTREQTPNIKKAFNGLGEKRHSERTLSDVGYHFA